MKKEILKKNKGINTRHNPSVRIKDSTAGITLIALVITIIVLLILAGVAISMLSGENGILKQAAEAKNQTEKASTVERVRIAALSALTAGKGKVDIDDLNRELNKIEGYNKENSDVEKLPTIIKFGEDEILIDENGTVVEGKENIVEAKDKKVISDFTKNGTDYKFKNGYLTDIIVENDEGNNDGKTETVESVENKLPNEYKICKIDGNDITSKDSTLITTGMVIKKGDEVVGRIIIFGDLDCDGHINANDILELLRLTNDFEDYIKVAADINMDGYINMEDQILVTEMGLSDELGQSRAVQKAKSIVVESYEEYVNRILKETVISGKITKIEFEEEWNDEYEDEAFFIIHVDKGTKIEDLATADSKYIMKTKVTGTSGYVTSGTIEDTKPLRIFKQDVIDGITKTVVNQDIGYFVVNE